MVINSILYVRQVPTALVAHRVVCKLCLVAPARRANFQATGTPPQPSPRRRQAPSNLRDDGTDSTTAGRCWLTNRVWPSCRVRPPAKLQPAHRVPVGVGFYNRTSISCTLVLHPSHTISGVQRLPIKPCSVRHKCRNGAQSGRSEQR